MTHLEFCRIREEAQELPIETLFQLMAGKLPQDQKVSEAWEKLYDALYAAKYSA